MKICGLIAEYNPFHNGHLFHLQEARKITGADAVIVLMSGNYVQRGTPALIDKIERTRMALKAGADAVFEIPSLFATSSAEVYATAAVSLLTQLGAVDSMCFGTECGDLSVLNQIADVLNEEPYFYQEELKTNLKLGYHFAKARALALSAYFKDSIPNLDDILLQSNNILGIEYLRALKRLESRVIPYTVKRDTTEYYSIQSVGNIASATTVRDMIYDEEHLSDIRQYVPAFVADEFEANYGITTPIRAGDFSAILQYRLSSQRENLEEYLDFSPELKERVNHLLPDIFDFREWAGALKTKAYTQTRIHRALLHVILNMKEADLLRYKEDDYCVYARILGIKKEASPCLSVLHDSTSLPFISKMADARKLLNDKEYDLLKFDIDGTDLYRNIVFNKFHTMMKDEFTANVVIE